MCRRTLEPMTTGAGSPAAAGSPQTRLRASTLSGSMSVKRMANSPPFSAACVQTTSPEARTLPPLPASNRHVRGCPASGRYAVRSIIPSSDTLTAWASNAGPRAPPTSTSPSNGVRLMPGARRSSLLISSSVLLLSR